MLQVFWSDSSGVKQQIPSEEWKALLLDPKGLLWVDIENPTEDELDLLSDVYEFHPLSIEDCIFPNHRPKIDDYEEYLFVIFHSMAIKGDVYSQENLDILELNIYLGPNYIVTVHEDPIPVIRQVKTKCSMNNSLLCKGTDFLLHLIIDTVVDDETRIFDRIEDKLDEIEDEIIADKGGALEKINEFKGLLSKFRKVSGPQRDVIRMMMSHSFSFISTHQVIYFKDIHDHLISINENTTLMKEMIASMMESYYSMISKKLNDVMKILTVVTIIFLPLNLITGFYGMNLQYLPPESQWEYSNVFIILFMLLIAVTLVLFFRKKKWI
ncbi:MAG: magnesium and cobalt transport protein CorA [Candidatus Hydrogenedentes bacterium CG07_land_8_20_14_0_80_42_17]|nr:MAG: magnesium and cobalt transport protein CorA [Candidatus Hydrogenedentes bacterium CG07_land_8_20_14_0_80_42_17]